MTTTAPVPTAPDARRTAIKTVAALAIGVVAYQAIRFFLRDPLHYVLDFSEKSFGGYWPHRVALLFHLAGGTLALFSGPFQLWSGLRRRSLPVHRLLGYLYLTGIVVGGAAGFYLGAYTQPRDFGVALWGLAAAWWTTVGMAFLAIRRRRIEAHREWMIRGYVVTLAFVFFRWWIDWPIWKPLGPSAAATVGWICWVAPLMVTEVALQWRRTVGPSRGVQGRIGG